MLSRIRVRKDQDIFQDLHVGLINRGGFWLKEVTGIGPVNAEVSYSEYALLDGGVYHSTNRTIRNIVMRIGFQPDYAENQTVQSLRRELYKAMAPKTAVAVSFYDDGTYVMYTNGIVESLEPNIFSKDPEIAVSIICVEPSLKGSSSKVETGLSGQTLTIPYEGSEERGYQMEFALNSNVNYVQIRDLDRGHRLRINRNLVSGERVRIVTEQGYKDATVRHANGDFKERVLAYTEIEGGWPQLWPGSNRILCNVQLAPAADLTLTYREHFVGF